jgi:rifampin ADP-ribosylating transferase
MKVKKQAAVDNHKMEFNPNNPIVRLCLQGMAMEDAGRPKDAIQVFLQAWNEATNDLERFLAAYYVARHQAAAPDRLRWLQTSLAAAQKINDDAVKAAFPSLYEKIALCHDELGEPDKANERRELAHSFRLTPSDKGPFYHGTRANLQIGNLLTPGFRSNYHSGLVMNHIYFTALINGAGLAAALANGEGRERVYIVEPTGPFEHDPNVTDKKFPGNPTRSYRTDAPLKIIGEVRDWDRLTPEQIQQWRDRMANSKGKIIN